MVKVRSERDTLRGFSGKLKAELSGFKEELEKVQFESTGRDQEIRLLKLNLHQEKQVLNSYDESLKESSIILGLKEDQREEMRRELDELSAVSEILKINLKDAEKRADKSHLECCDLISTLRAKEVVMEALNQSLQDAQSNDAHLRMRILELEAENGGLWNENGYFKEDVDELKADLAFEKKKTDRLGDEVLSTKHLLDSARKKFDESISESTDADHKLLTREKEVQT